MKGNKKKISSLKLLNHYFDFLPQDSIYLISKYVGRWISLVPPKLPIYMARFKYKTRKQKFYHRHFIKIHDSYMITL